METDQRIQSFVRVFEQYNRFKDALKCRTGIDRLALRKFYLKQYRKAYWDEWNPHLFDFIKKQIKEKDGQRK